MIAEGIAALAALATKANKPERLDVKDPRKAYYVIDGKPVDVDIPVPPRDHAVGSLADLIGLANRFAGEGETKPAVWYDHERVVLVFDDDVSDPSLDAHRVEKATLTLEQSDAFGVVVMLRDKGPAYDQPAFIRLLRIKLARCLDPVTLLNVVRKVKFENSKITTGEKQRDRESMGREITSSVSADGLIPEEVRLAVPVFKTLHEDTRYGLVCSVEVEPLEGIFRLVPLPDEIERVRNLALESIEERLTAGLENGVPHYFGKP